MAKEKTYYLLVRGHHSDNEMCETLQEAIEVQAEVAHKGPSAILILHFNNWPATGRLLPPQASMVLQGGMWIPWIEID